MLVPGLSIVTVNDEQRKDTMSISLFSIFLLIMGILLYLCIRIIIYRMAGKYTSDRTDEELIIKDNVLCYTYRLAHTEASQFERNLIQIPVDRIHQVSYDMKSGKIIFRGEFYASYKQKEM